MILILNYYNNYLWFIGILRYKRKCNGNNKDKVNNNQ